MFLVSDKNLLRILSLSLGFLKNNRKPFPILFFLKADFVMLRNFLKADFCLLMVYDTYVNML